MPAKKHSPRTAARRRDNPFVTQVRRALAEGRPERVPDSELADVFTAAVKLGFAKLEAGGRVPRLIHEDEVSATEAVVAISEMIRAANLNLLDVAMWFRRPLPSVGAREETLDA